MFDERLGEELIAVPIERYEKFLDMDARIRVLADIMSHKKYDYIDRDELELILGIQMPKKNEEEE